MCMGDWMCSSCWDSVQEFLWFEEFEPDMSLSESDYWADSEPETVEQGSPTVCPPTSDTDIDFEQASSSSSS